MSGAGPLSGRSQRRALYCDRPENAVDLHGGTITVFSHEERGARFVVRMGVTLQ